ncbi:DUF1937 family protein [Ruegeria sp. ANG-R]|uniref:DUF1937 family protein n=1 Tax=Ruegeria sp. ANG-R TaxID=1577903 RepID=UPI00068A0AB7|nr:DUF1937 family protein [Ruegeria sp. ANG-R]
MGVEFKMPDKIDWAALIRAYPDDVLLHVDSPVSEVVRSARSRMAYLATPYSKEVLNDDGRWDRALSLDVEMRTARWARLFARDGLTVVSPILQACAIVHADTEGDIDPMDDHFWSAWCMPLMSVSASFIIPPMEGWDRSWGVWREACWALWHNIPVYLIRPGSEFGGGA